MTKNMGQQRWATSDGGRKYLELPHGRDPLPEPHETEWDKWALHHKRKGRAAARKPLLDNSPLGPVPSPPR